VLLFGAHLVIDWTHRLALAKDLERHALPQVALAAAVGEEARFRGHHVDEAGRDDLAVNVEVEPAEIRRNISHFGDGVAAVRNASRSARRAGSVTQAAIIPFTCILTDVSRGILIIRAETIRQDPSTPASASACATIPARFPCVN
jgi:hypothetical protein